MKGPAIFLAQFAGFAPAQLRDKPDAWPAWATQQLKHAAKASQRLKLKAHATFSCTPGFSA